MKISQTNAWHVACSAQPVSINWDGVKMTEAFRRFAADESGATAIEYGLIASGIALAIITVVQGVGTKLNGTFTNVKNGLK